MVSDSSLTALSPSSTSTLSSLTPSPDRAPSGSPSRKRPRLSSTSPPPARLSVVGSPAKVAAPQTYDDLLEGLQDDDFRLPPSSNPVCPREDGVEEEEEHEEGLPVVAEGVEEAGMEIEPVGEAEARAADDSGVGLLPDLEQVKAAAPPVPAAGGEPPDGDELEYDGDDLWLEFDEADVGFDQPSAFHSSMLSAAAVPSARDKGKGIARATDEETEPQAREEPRLHDFGFTGLGGAQIQPGGGFVFATRKPLVVSEEAMRRARALLQAEDEPAQPKPQQNSILPPPTRTSTPLARPAFSRPPPVLAPSPRPASPLSRPSVAGAPPPSALSTFGGFQTAAGTSVTLHSADALARAQKSLQGSSSPIRPFTTTAPTASTSTSRPPLLAPANTHPPAPPPFLGFQNAAGRTLDMPSEDAMRRAQEQLDARSSSPVAGPSRARGASRPPTRPPSRVPSRSDGRDVFEGASATVGGAAKFALPSPVARLAAAGGAVPDSPTTARVRMSSSERSGDGSASSGRRTPLAPMDANAALPAEGKELEEEDGASSATLRSSSPAARSNPPPANLDDLPPLAAAVPPLPPLPSTAPPVQTPLVAPVPLRPVPSAPRSATSTRPPSTALPSSARGLPFRTPFLPSHSTPSRGPSASFTPLRSSSLAPTITLPASSSRTPNPLLPGPPGGQRRLNLGMTPRSKPYHLANTRVGTPRAIASGVHATPGGVGPRTGVKAFKTPFKGGKPPEGLTPVGLKGKMQEVLVKGSEKKASAKRGKGVSVAAAAGAALDPKREKAKVFELDAKGAERFNLLNFGMRPQTHYYEHLQKLHLPTEILDMDDSSGLSYVFPCGSSVQTAFTSLQDLVASRMPDEKDLVTLPWVKNHWTLILWKLASYVRSRPDLLEEWWTFERVMEQLRYRYEREINLAQRSYIKRIQEHDSPASLPMVLCVSQVRWDDPAESDSTASTTTNGDAPLVIVGLELTDGWYRIRTNVDETLKSACERGKIVVGSKIAVMGAKLESSKNEGQDVLQALSRSSLIISGNSTSLAPWHATLGFHREPFVSSLTRLSSKGGLVPLVDVIVERAYPCGYIDLSRGRSTETWGEEEEQVRAEEWKRGRKKLEAKLADEAEKAGVDEDEVVELLQEAAESLASSSTRGPTSTPSEEPDEILDRLESASNKAALIRKLSPQQVRSCLALALENAQASRFRVVEDLQKELAEKYPPRDVRGFRVVRIRDAQVGEKTSNRTALLTIWDAQSFEEGFVKEGGRYLVSNLLPKGSWRRGDLEISLATRRDSRWSKV